MADLLIVETKGGKRVERTLDIRLTMHAIRIAERRIGHSLGEFFGEAPRRLGFGEAMEIVAAGMLHTNPQASVQLVEKMCDADPPLAPRVVRAAGESIIEAFARMTPAQEDEHPTEPQSESDQSA